MIITDEAFPYLTVQQGRLDHLKADRPSWEAAYRAGLEELFQAIKPHLPATCARLLDVGGGLGGIGARLNAHFGGNVEVAIVDGLADQPCVHRHATTFSNGEVAQTFLQANGVRLSTYIPADWAADRGAWGPITAPKYDLVLGIASWGFHFAPATYLEFVAGRCHPGTVIIIEVREGKADWLQQLLTVFDPVAANVFPKFTRWVLRPHA